MQIEDIWVQLFKSIHSLLKRMTFILRQSFGGFEAKVYPPMVMQFQEKSPEKPQLSIIDHLLVQTFPKGFMPATRKWKMIPNLKGSFQTAANYYGIRGGSRLPDTPRCQTLLCRTQRNSRNQRAAAPKKPLTRSCSTSFYITAELDS